jgi:predicted XRE-type DNA-binding protein
LNEEELIMKSDRRVTQGSGNIFADLDLPQAEDELLKARLVAVIRDVIEQEGISQTTAGARMHLAQPDVSRLLRGRLTGFSLERLLGFVRALGGDVKIEIKLKTAEGRVRKVA